MNIYFINSKTDGNRSNSGSSKEKNVNNALEKIGNFYSLHSSSKDGNKLVNAIGGIKFTICKCSSKNVVTHQPASIETPPAYGKLT